MKNVRHPLLPALLLLLSGTLTAQPLLNRPEKQAVPVKAGQVSCESQAIRLRFDDPEWSSGMRLDPPPGQSHWNLSGWKVLAVDVENLSTTAQMRLTMHLSSGSRAQKNVHEINTGIGLNPGEKRTMRLLLPHQFLYAAPSGGKGPRTVDTAKLNPIAFQMQWPFESRTPGLVDCRLTNLRLEQPVDRKQDRPVDPEKFFPFIDVYGQYIHADWPEKIHADADLKHNLIAEQKELDAARRPASWDRYGGWADGPQRTATGAFRTEKYQGKWYLVDPDGRLFFSHGLDVLHAHTDATRTRGHEKWFQHLPPGATQLDFTDHCLQVKYGRADYLDAFYRNLSKRLLYWGFNTIGNWARSELMARGDTPYALQLTDYNARWPGIQDSKLKFYDVFDPRFEERMGNLLADRAKVDPQTRKSLNDPMCIGYFIDNELKFGDFIKALMKAPPIQPAKIEFVRELQKRYASIAELNRAWKTAYADWSALLESRTEPQSAAFKKDSRAFHARAVDRYFATCRAAIKKVAPHRLYLGSRFVGFRQPDFLWQAAAKYCDVISVNAYTHSAANCDARNFHDKPVLIGEFHFGIFDRGMFAPSLCPAGLTQAERAVAYTRFMQGVLVHPNLVGAHWFQFRDQPLTGRWDGEGYQIGFVDGADTPYPNMIAASRKVGENMYRYRQAGKLVNTME